MRFHRLLDLQKVKTSAFLFGPRMTGKTSLIKSLKGAHQIDLLDPEKELEFKQAPRRFWEIISALPKGSLVAVDEIQKVPALLDYVQKGIEELGLRFILSGSSARKLRRGGANLLGGRARDLKLHALAAEEIGDSFRVSDALEYGTLPKISDFFIRREIEEVKALLKSYYTTYIKEEIQAEALTRNVGAFQRFLNIAVQSNGQMIEFQNISRECSVPSSTVKEYYSILEDTLLGEFLWPWDRSERKKARPKFYFFDCGVVRAIQNRLNDPPTPAEMGILFETWFFGELKRCRDYFGKAHEFSLWREGAHEIDLLVSGGRGPLAAFELKSGRSIVNNLAVKAFKSQFPKVPLFIVSLSDKIARKSAEGFEIIPWKTAIDYYKDLA